MMRTDRHRGIVRIRLHSALGYVVACGLCLATASTTFGQFSAGFTDQGSRNSVDTAALDDGFFDQDATSEPGQVNNITYAGEYGDEHHFSAFASTSSVSPAGGFNWRPNTGDWLRDFQTGLYVNEENLVVTAGGQATVLETCDFYSGVRTLGTFSDLDHSSSGIGYSIDWFAARPVLCNARHEHYAKVGVFHDQQNDLYQTGGTFGALLFADCCRPITIDAAIGFGGGQNPVGANGILEAAEHDYQLRVGTYLSPTVQAGVSAFRADWDNVFNDDGAWGVGAFANVQLSRALVQLDVAGGDDEVSGFVNLIFTPGACCTCSSEDVVRGQNLPLVDAQCWMSRPVNRNLAIRTRTRNNGGVGGVTFASSVAVFPPDGAQVIDNNNNGTADPGDQFEVDFIFTAGPQGAMGVAFGANTTVIGPGAQVGGVGAVVGDLMPGEMRRTDRGTDACIRIDAGAQPGDQIFLEYDVTADGVTRRFRTGPYTVGQVVNGTTAPSSPL